MPLRASYAVPHPPLIIPEIGNGEETAIQDTIDAYNKIAKEIAEIDPDLIIISSPHSQLYQDYFQIEPSKSSGNLSQFGARDLQLQVKLDHESIKKINQEGMKQDFPIGTKGQSLDSLDHGITVPLYFILKQVSKIPFVFVSPSGESLPMHYKAGMIISDALYDKEVVWVASGDLSHKLKESGPYGYAKEGPKLDEVITDSFKSANFLSLLTIPSSLRRKGADCGVGSFNMMAGAFDGYDVRSTLHSYEGPFGVGYAVASFKPKSKNDKRQFLKEYQSMQQKELMEQKKQEDEYVSLARQTVEYYVQHEEIIPLPTLSSNELTSKKAGVFVTIHKDGNLRGCIGTINPQQECTAKEIIHNAISSCSKDYRFSPITKKELASLSYSVDVLFPSEPIDSIQELDPSTYGVIVSNKNKSGLLLPNLDGIDTAKEQIKIAKRKANIKENEHYSLERFKVIRHH